MNKKFWLLLAIPGMASLGYLASNWEPPAAVAPTSGGDAQPISTGVMPAPPRRAGPEWVDSATYTADGPYPVDLGNVPVAQYDPYNKLARGWGISGGPKRITKRISPEEADRLRAEALLMPPSRGIEFPEEAAGASAAGDIFGFPSLDISDCCGGGANVPPDPELAVGPEHIIAVVNVAFAIYDKTGTLLAGPVTFSSFFENTPGCSNTAVFDPNVLYDEEADRFILGIDGNGTDYCVAATTDSDPLGTWNRYGFVTNFANAFFDYPHAGVGVDAVFMGSNQFGGTLRDGFEGRVFAMDKVALYTGSPLTVVTHSTGSNGTPQPMNLHGFEQGTWPSSGPHYIMTEVFDGATHTVWSWNDPFGADTFVRKGDLNLNAATGIVAGFPVDVPQLGSTKKLQANDWRGLDNEYRNGSIWMTNTIACKPGAVTVDCVRWAKIDPSVPSIVEAGVVASADQYRTFPDLAVNQCEDVAIGYSKSSATQYPGVYAIGFENGVLQPELQLKAGEVPYTAFDTTPHRWGDYTGMTIDPDGERFWYLGEYSKNTGDPNGRWGTYIGSFKYSSCNGDVAEVGASIEGIKFSRVTCWNLDTKQTVRVSNPGTAWDCLSSGLTVSPQDRVAQVVRGWAADSSVDIAGTLAGLDGRSIRCTNKTTEQTIRARLVQPEWNCTDLGLNASRWDLVEQVVLGVVR